MSPQQTAAYLARICDRIAAIREDTNKNATSIRTRITNTVHRDSLGHPGESARQTRAASQGEYYDGSQESEDDLRDLSPVESHWHGWDGDSAEQDWEVRSDSMEPLRGGQGKDILEGDKIREDWELDMDREDERCMEIDRSMSLGGFIAEEKFLNGEVESDMYVAYHSLNSRAMRKMRLDEVERMYQSGGRYSTVGRNKMCEIQNMLQKYSEESDATRQEDKDDVVSNPYPEDDDLIPLTLQPNSRSLYRPNKANSVPTAELSISSNPYPEDAPTSLTQPPPPIQPPYSPHRPITPSTLPPRFQIYPQHRTISSITPSNASRCALSPVSSSSTQSHAPSHPVSQTNAYNHSNDVEGYASNHPHHGMSQKEAQEYWHDLEGYNTEGEGHPRRQEVTRDSRHGVVSSPVQYPDDRVLGSTGENYVGHLGNETVGEQKGRNWLKKGNMVGQFFSSFACRPGTVSPDDAAVPVQKDASTGMVSIVPRKHAVAYLCRKMGRTQRKDEDAKPREGPLALQPSAPNEKRMQNIEDGGRAMEGAQQVPRARKRSEGTRRRSKPRVVNVDSQAQGVIGPPVDLSKMIQRAPESIRTPSPLPVSDAGSPGISGDVHRAPRETHSDSSSSLSDRLRRTKLEDLPLRFGAAEEIRNLMLDLERDRRNGPSATSVQHGDQLTSGSDPTTTTPTGQTSKLPGGFSRPASPTTPAKPGTSPSPRETLERDVNNQRQANRQYALQVRVAKSHSSNLTLPPSFRAPEMHSSVLSIPRGPSPLVQMASAEDFRASHSGEEDVQ